MRKNSCLLPKAKRKDSHVTRSRQTVFGGLSSSPVPTKEEISYMENLSAKTYPAIGTLEKRFSFDVSASSGAPHGLCLHDGIFVARGQGLYALTKDGALSRLMGVSDTDKTFASFGKKLFVLPDRICYDTAIGRIRALSADTGFLQGASLGSNYVTFAYANWQQKGFEVGDGVEIHVKDYIIGSTTVFKRKVLGMTEGTLFFDSSFERTGTFDIAVKRSFPEVTHLCAMGDRLVGYHGNTVYLSEAGNPFNWSSVSGEDNDPVTLETAGSGDITACAVYRGYGVFFKEDRLYQLMGHHARDYFLDCMTAPGISSHSGGSLCEVGGWLYYLSPGGVYRFDGRYPEYVGQGLPQGLTHGVGGGDGQCYYLAAQESGGSYRVYAYHCENRMWYVQDPAEVKAMATQGDLLFWQTADGALFRNARLGEKLSKNQTHMTEIPSALPSVVEFGAEFGGASQGLRLHGVHLRAKNGPNSSLRVYVAYDGGEIWEPIGSVTDQVNGMIHLSVYPRRAESYRLRLVMDGEWLISELICEYERGKQ